MSAARKSGWTEEAKHAADFLAGMPQYGNTTLKRADYQSLQFETGGQLLACGYLWEIIGKKIAPDIYRVSLKPWRQS